MASRDRRNILFPKLIARGENRDSEDGFCGVNVNGTLRAGDVPGWNFSEEGSIGQPTNMLPTDKGGSGYRRRQLAPKEGTRRIGNRTGE